MGHPQIEKALNTMNTLWAVLSLGTFPFCFAAIAQDPTRIELDVKQAAAEISPLLFGHNLEVTRRGIWQGLGAEMVANRKFAAVDKALPRGWTAVADGGRVTADGKSGYAGRQSAR